MTDKFAVKFCQEDVLIALKAAKVHVLPFGGDLFLILMDWPKIEPGPELPHGCRWTLLLDARIAGIIRAAVLVHIQGLQNVIRNFEAKKHI